MKLKPNSSNIKNNLVLLAASIAVAFFILEIFARLLIPAPRPWRYPPVRYRADPNLTFGLLPNQQAFSRDKPVTINERGLRGPLVPYERDPNVLRILFLGDSVMFGHSVDYQNIAATRVEQLLNDKRIPSEIVNSSVPSYNTRQEVAYLEHEGTRYDPDWVIVGFYWNDINTKSGVRVSSDGLLMDEDTNESELSFSTRLWISELGYSIRNAIKTIRFIYGANQGWEALVSGQSDSPNSRVREDLLNGRDSPFITNGWQQVSKSFHQLKLLAERDGFRPAIAAFPIPQALEQSYPDSSYLKQLREISEREQIPLIDLDPGFRAAYTGHESLFIPYDADHPNAAGHAVAAETIVKFLVEKIEITSEEP